MGMEGSWSGPGGGGYREFYLAKLLHDRLNKRTILLYGTGNTRTLEQLREKGIDAVGCDISPDVIDYKKKLLGDDAFYSPEELPAERRFDAIVAVEVFEHFAEPLISFSLLLDHRSEGGIICGTTSFYPGGAIEDGNDPGYMQIGSHVAYWSTRSMSRLAAMHDLRLTEFEMVCPGSVKPDEKYGQLYPNKRVFFLQDGERDRDFLVRLKETDPILPIDRP